MLVFAKLYEHEIIQASQALCTKKRFKWLHNGYINPTQIDDSDWNVISRVSYCKKVLGFMNAQTDRANGVITSVTLWSVPNKTINESKIFTRDLLDFLLYLVTNFPTIQFFVTIGNPIQRRYQKFIKYIGGNVVGTTHQCIRIDGKLRDKEVYEILSSEEVINKIKELKEKI